MTAPDRLIGLARWIAYLSGLVSIVGLVLLGMFYAVGQPFGTLNDEVVVVQYLLALPLILALHRLLAGPDRELGTIALAAGIAGILAIAVLQMLLIMHVLSFRQQVGPVSAALFILFGGSLLIAGYRGRRMIPRSMLMAILGWSYVGYPIWAFWLAGRLRAAPIQPT